MQVALERAFKIAAGVQGGEVYSAQTVTGLSDQDPAAPLVAAFVPVCGGRPMVLGGADATRGVLAQSAFKPLTFAMALHADCADEISVVADPEEFAGPDLAANAEPQANPVDEAIGAPAAYIYNV